MRLIFSFLAGLLSIYSFLIIIRIILTWFAHAYHSKPVQFLSRITDPYLDWWRQRFRLQVGVLDISPIIAMAALSVVQNICSAIARQGRFTVGIILSVCLSAIWSVASFILGFCFLVLVLRFIAFIGNCNIHSPFWSIIDNISRPLLYRINRILFGNRMVKFTTGIFVSIGAIAAMWILGRLVVRLLSVLLIGIGI